MAFTIQTARGREIEREGYCKVMSCIRVQMTNTILPFNTHFAISISMANYIEKGNIVMSGLVTNKD